MHNLLCPHAQKSFKTNMALWLHKGGIRVHECERGGILAVASEHTKKHWVKGKLYVINAFHILWDIKIVKMLPNAFNRSHTEIHHKR